MIGRHSAVQIPGLKFDILQRPKINYQNEIRERGRKISIKLERFARQLPKSGINLYFFEGRDDYYQRFEDEDRDELLLNEYFCTEFVDIKPRDNNHIEIGIEGVPNIMGGIESRLQVIFKLEKNDVKFKKVGWHERAGQIGKLDNIDALKTMIFADRLTDGDMFFNMCLLSEKPKN